MRCQRICFCLPTAKKVVPAGPRGQIRRVPAARRTQWRPRAAAFQEGLDWTKRYPWIVETARKVRKSRFILDGEAVVLGVDGISDFDALQSRQHDDEVQVHAFDCLANDGDDRTGLPLHLRKTNLEQLLRGRSDGIFVAPFEQGEIGPALFDAACRMKLDGIVSKHRERPYRVGRCDHWQKVKNRKHPAFTRVAESF
jgi:bifunctional non-homologous end joining protein LigD